jgi:hypothetical protein
MFCWFYAYSISVHYFCALQYWFIPSKKVYKMDEYWEIFSILHHQKYCWCSGDILFWGSKVEVVMWILFCIHCVCWLGSSVSIATDYGLDSPGIESWWGEIFHPFRLALGPPSLLYSGYRVFCGGKVRPGRAADHLPPSSAAVMEE